MASNKKSEPAAPARANPVLCVHEHLNEDGYCRKCGTDFRSGVETPPAQASGTAAMSEERLQYFETRCPLNSGITELCTEIRRLRSPDQRTLAAYQQGLEDGRSAPAQPDIRADYMQIVPGSGVCFEHGPYPGSQCPDPSHGDFTATVMPAQPEQGSVDNPETWKGIGETYDKPTIAQPDVEAAREIAKRLTQKLVDEGQQFKDRGGCLQWPGSFAIEQAIVEGAEAYAASETAAREQSHLESVRIHVGWRESADARAKQAEAENEQWRTWGIVELAVRNTNVASYVEHWEGRTEKAEAKNERLQAQLKRPFCPDCDHGVVAGKVCDSCNGTGHVERRKNQQAELERLRTIVATCERDIGKALADYNDSRAQLAQMREALEQAKTVFSFTGYLGEVTKIDNVLSSTVSSAEWLEKHDAEVAAKALRDAPRSPSISPSQANGEKVYVIRQIFYLERWDEEAKTFVGYIPIADRYTQGWTRERLKESVESLIDTLQPILIDRLRARADALAGEQP